jgi:hypothetical protein
VKLVLIPAFFVLAAMMNASAEPNQMLCSGEEAAGLSYDRTVGKWRPAAFRTEKYLLRRLNPDDRDKQSRWAIIYEHFPKANWAFFTFGEDKPIPLVICTEDTGEHGGPQTFRCQPTSEFYDGAFDKETRRFELIKRGSYINQGFNAQLKRSDPEIYKKGRADRWAGDPDNPDDLFVEIGKCTPDF